MKKILIVYDSVFGNTEQIARAIGNELGSQEEIDILKAGGTNLNQLEGLELLLVGSPTQRFRPTPAISDLLKSIPNHSLKGVKVAAFDTRLTTDEINETPILAFFVRLFGHSAYAARYIANNLRKRGGELVVPFEGFYVEGMKGPLVQGELERATNWARKINTEIQREMDQEK